ncbi:MAG: M28 family peptidase [Candidatus Thorarchaeota archaeon]
MDCGRMRFTWTILILLIIPLSIRSQQVTYIPEFDGTNAMAHLVAQCDFGPRPPGSDNLSRCREYIVDTLESHGWSTTLQNFTYRDESCANIIAWHGPIRNATVILSAHYDTRPYADNDPDPANRSRPVLGANDGASGTAVLLEMARVLPIEVRDNVELVFFDAEDSGYIDGWDWIVGSTYYVDQLIPSRVSYISSMILLDMVGDSDLRLQRESSSIRSLQDLIWSLAEEMSYQDTFLDSFGAAILDDHKPFLDADIPSVDIIHHNPFPATWHTVDDIPERCSAESLQIVGEVVETYLVTYSGTTIPSSPGLPISYYVLVLGVVGVAALLVYGRVKKG